MNIDNRDWKLFRERLPKWQSAHIEKLNGRYIELLSVDGDPADKFWKLEKTIRNDEKHPGVILEMRKDNMLMAVVTLLKDKAIDFEDLDGFTEQFKETVAYLLER